MACSGIVVCAFSRAQTRNALSRNIVAQVSDRIVASTRMLQVCTSLQAKPISEPWGVACHMGSHGYLPPETGEHMQGRQTITRFTDPQRDGRLS